MKTLFFALIIFINGSMLLQAQNRIEVEVTNFNSNQGVAMIALYNTEASFPNEPFKGEKVEIMGGKAVHTFYDLTPGTYAIMLYHDKDEDGKLSTNFLGIPKEKFAASNNAPARFGPPSWEDAKFELRKGQTVKQRIVL